MRLWHPKLLSGITVVTLLIAGVTIWRAPVIREEWQHYLCVKREETKAEREGDFARASLGSGKVTKDDILAFLRANHPSVPVRVTEGEVQAGLMIFRIDENDEMIDLLQMSPCPVAKMSPNTSFERTREG